MLGKIREMVSSLFKKPGKTDCAGKNNYDHHRKMPIYSEIILLDGSEIRDHPGNDCIYSYSVKKGKVKEIHLKTVRSGLDGHLNEVKIIPVSDFAIIKATRMFPEGKRVLYSYIGLMRNKKPYVKSVVNL